MILRKQLEQVLEEDIDDLLKQTLDSTAVKANSAWPTDGKILIGLLGRAHRFGQMLDLFGLENFPKGWDRRWLKQLERLEFEICLNADKAHSRRKMEKSYRLFTIKEGFEFGELGRRGIDAVRAELMEKVLAHNCCRTILLKKRRREERKKAA